MLITHIHIHARHYAADVYIMGEAIKGPEDTDPPKILFFFLSAVVTAKQYEVKSNL